MKESGKYLIKSCKDEKRENKIGRLAKSNARMVGMCPNTLGT